MRFHVLAPLAALALAGCGSAVPTAEEAKVRLPVVPGRPGAGYLTVRGGDKADRLTGAESPAVQSIEIHEGGMQGGMMTMRRLDGIDLPAGGKVVLAPGGYHLMLFGIDPGVRAGATVPITLRFESGAKVTVEATAETMVGVGEAH